jgi:acetyl esterase/lipase
MPESNPDIQPNHTLVYKTVDQLNISLDVYLPAPAPAHPVPVLLWFHGGGLLQGHRNTLPRHLRNAVQQYEIAVISADYRLAPQVSVADILADVQDCIAFIRTRLAAQLPQTSTTTTTLDPTRLAVSGSSAGGYLALLAGLYADPKPAVVLPIYPITDPLGTFFTTRQPPAMGRPLKAREELAEFLDPAGEVVANNPGDSVRQHLYVRMQHDANLAALWKVPGRPAGDRFRVARNVYAQRCPPAYFLHGDADTGVSGDMIGERERERRGADSRCRSGWSSRMRSSVHWWDVGWK